MMLQPESVWLAVAPVDMRIGIDGLSLRVQQALGRAPCDGCGVWLCQRRLHRGSFTWPQANDSACELSAQQWQWLVAGVDWQRLSAPPPAHWLL